LGVGKDDLLPSGVDVSEQDLEQAGEYSEEIQL